MGRLCVVFFVILTSCRGDDDACIDVDLTCQPLYDPVFDEVFTRTLLPKCGVPGSACHGDSGRQNGLGFVTADEAYDLLLASRVVPGDPGCSLIVRRIESSDSSFVMPPGAPIAAAERCAIIQWIADGAQR